MKMNALVVRATALRGNIGFLERIALEPVVFNALPGTCKYKNSLAITLIFIYLGLHRNFKDRKLQPISSTIKW